MDRFASGPQRVYGAKVDTENKASEPLDPVNDALAAELRGRKGDLRVTFEYLAAETGINLRTIKRLLAGERPIMFGYFIKLCEALDLDPAEVIESVEARASKTLA